MIRWEQQENGNWHRFSGELPVATVAKDPDAEREQWAWKIKGLKRPKDWRKPIGHHTTWLGARRAADAYWEKWLGAASLRPDLERLAMQSLPPEERPKARRRRGT
ncbi:MAG: hypothetical protein ACJ8DH_05545 [Microvirga sp.]